MALLFLAFGVAMIILDIRSSMSQSRPWSRDLDLTTTDAEWVNSIYCWSSPVTSVVVRTTVGHRWSAVHVPRRCPLFAVAECAGREFGIVQRANRGTRPAGYRRRG